MASNNLSKIIRLLYYCLFFLTPLLLWPFTSEVFEFNKMLFVYFITISVSFFWIAKSITEKKFTITKTPFDLALAIFLISQTISTIISIDLRTSLFGYYSRFHGGLFSTLSYIVLFYGAVTHLDSNSAKKIKTLILASGFLVSVYAVLEKLGIDKNVWVQDVQNRVFSTLGQPNWLSAYLIAILPLSLTQITRDKSKTNQSLIHLSLSFLFLLAIFFTKSQSGLGATIIILTLFSLYKIYKAKKYYLFLIPVSILVLLIVFAPQKIRQTLTSLNNINPLNTGIASVIEKENQTRVGGSDSMIIRRLVWEGAIKLGLQKPLFGYGLETFGYTYYQVRSPLHNLTSESDFLYNKAHNEYLNQLANSGFVGLASLIFLTASILVYLAKRSLPLFLGIISIIITNFFGFSVVIIGLFFFLFPAIAFLQSDKSNRASLISISLPNSKFLLTVFGVVYLYLCLRLTNTFRADTFYASGRMDPQKADTAVSLNPNEPTYRSQNGYLKAYVLASYLIPKAQEITPTATEEQKKQISKVLDEYFSSSLQELNTAINQNPHQLNFHKTKARALLLIAPFRPEINMEIENTLEKIIDLSPSDAVNYLNLGLFLKNTDQESKAQRYIEKSLELNPSLQTAKDSLKTKTAGDR